jgi:hypothetical protein
VFNYSVAGLGVSHNKSNPITAKEPMTMFSRFCLIAAICSCGFLTVPVQGTRAGLITNGSFEQGAFVGDGDDAMSLSPGSTTITGWTTINAEITWIDNGNPLGIVASDGVKSLDLTGYHDSRPYGGIEQTIATTQGQTYVLGFDILGNLNFGSSPSVLASAGSTTSTFTFNPTAFTAQSQYYTLNFTATSASTVVSFVGTGSGGVYIGLDNVSVVPVPEPASLALLSMGISSLVYHRLRRTV